MAVVAAVGGAGAGVVVVLLLVLLLLFIRTLVPASVRLFVRWFVLLFVCS